VAANEKLAVASYKKSCSLGNAGGCKKSEELI